MKKLKELSTFWQMSILTFLAIISIFLITYISQFIVVRVWTVKYEKGDIESRYKEITALLNTDNSDYNSVIKAMDLDVIIYNSNKEVLFKTTDEIPSNFKFDLPIRAKKKVNINIKHDNVVLNSPIQINGNRVYIYIIKETDIYTDFLETTIPIILITMVLTIIISLLAGMYVSKKFVNKLRNLSDTMEKIKEKGISNRVVIQDKKDEFDKVNIVFNSMMDEVEKSFNIQKQFVEDASHELRTPLTILKGHLKMLYRWGKNDKETLDRSLKVSLEEVDRLTKLVNDLLQLSSAENESISTTELEPVNVGKVVNEVIYDFEIAREDINFECDTDENLYLYILPHHLKQLLIIFIDNAMKYCDKEEKYIKLKVFKDNEDIKISITDNGTGIPNEEIPKITDKFYRVDKSRKYNNSFGIGLSIASQIIKLYKGRLDIKSEVKIGTQITITFKYK